MNTKTIRVRQTDAVWIQIVAEAKDVSIAEFVTEVLTEYWKASDRDELRKMVADKVKSDLAILEVL